MLAASGVLLLATPAAAIELDEVTVVTLARDGSWGVATAGSTGEAIAIAVRACRTMARATTDCGAQFTAARGRWVVANLCGDHQIIASAETLHEAEVAALAREIRTRRIYVPHLPPCRSVLTVDPMGTVATGPRLSARAGTGQQPR